MKARVFLSAMAALFLACLANAASGQGLADTSFFVDPNEVGDVGRFAGKLPVLEGATGSVIYELIFDGGGVFDLIDEGPGIDFMNLDSYDPASQLSTPHSGLTITRPPGKFENVRDHRGRFAGTTHPESMQIPIQMIGSVPLNPDVPNILRFGVTNHSDSANSQLDFSIETVPIISTLLVADAETDGGYLDSQYDANFFLSPANQTLDFSFTHTANDWWQEWLWWSHLEIVNSGLFVKEGLNPAAGLYSVVIKATDSVGFTSIESYIVEIATPPGDFDSDGDIDGVDLAFAYGNFTGPVGVLGGKTADNGDLDGDGDVDGVDLGQLFTNFTGPLAPATVPEPSSLAFLALIGILTSRRRQIH